ncbi:hypothetical protein MtrunA17_Chr1g0171341 [Medicago truncatula]|uniref:Uncharacterized protein n=1 Tax=Medicago truncatula TaxID=3880 RepID=A0A396JL13_MEDTR|nr:hypothetical protein MtrunA17_Chr1g0171341 [Medicago truncatula]
MVFLFSFCYFFEQFSVHLFFDIYRRCDSFLSLRHGDVNNMERMNTDKTNPFMYILLILIQFGVEQTRGLQGRIRSKHKIILKHNHDCQIWDSEIILMHLNK